MNEKIYEIQYQCAKKVLELANKANSGHIGTSLSYKQLISDGKTENTIILDGFTSGGQMEVKQGSFGF